MSDFRVVLVPSSKGVGVSHLIASGASGPPWLTICDRQIFGRALEPGEVNQTIQTPCQRCVRVAGPSAMRDFDWARL